MELSHRLHRLIGPDATWSADPEGASGTALRVRSRSTTFYVKYGPLAHAEHLRLRWLHGRIAVPEVVAFDDPILVLADVGAPSLHSAAPASAKAAACVSVRKNKPPLASTGMCNAKPASESKKKKNVNRNAPAAARAILPPARKNASAHNRNQA